MGKGKHFIGDFLPPEELDKFMETFKALKVSLLSSLLCYSARDLPYQLFSVSTRWKRQTNVDHSCSDTTGVIPCFPGIEH